jgi:arylsulfatase A-like enzyme
MKFRKTINAGIAFAGALNVLSAPCPAPNVVLIAADDLGYGDLSVQGCDLYETPRIDSIARQGVRFTDGYVTAAYCSPSRAGFLTGRYQQRFGHEVLFWNKDHNIGLPVGEKTLADRLRDAGYETGMVGKWHLGKEKPFHPMSRGFSEFFGDAGHGSNYMPDPETGLVGWQNGTQIYYFERNGEPVEIRKYLTDVYADECVSFIQKHSGHPFFLYASFNAPHAPMEALPQDLERVKHIEHPVRRTYAAMILALDRGVGRILDAVKESGQEDNTIVVFLSDNGSNALSRGGGHHYECHAENAPFRGVKGLLTEGGVRVPFFIKWPGHIDAGAVYQNPVSSLDLAPTLFTAAGINVLPEWKLDGTDLVPFVDGRRSGAPHERLFWRYWRTGQNRQLCAVREGDWKLVTDHHLGGASPGHQSWSLYNLSNDPAEQNDLIQDYPEKAAELSKAWNGWNQNLARPAWYCDPP